MATIPGLRIVSDKLWGAVQRRRQASVRPDLRLKMGGKKRYVLSGLLECTECGGSFVIADATHYACNTHRDGGKCRNHWRTDRAALQAQIADPITTELLLPENVAAMSKLLEQEWARRISDQRAEALPAEVLALDQRIARLRARLKSGDPDMTGGEIAAVIASAEAQRAALLTRTPGKRGAQISVLLPGSGEMRKTLADGFLNLTSERAVNKARIALRELLAGKCGCGPQKQGWWPSSNCRGSLFLQALIGMVAGAGFEPATFGL